MRYTMDVSGRTVFVALMMLASSSALVFAQQTADFNLQTSGSGNNLAGVYTSPYQAYIGGSHLLTSVICDDFADNSFTPEDWTAYVTSLSSIVPGPDPNASELKWNGAQVTATVGAVTYDWSLSQAQAYTVAALLSIDILQSNPTNCLLGPSCPEAAAQEDYSYALWELFDQTTASGLADSTSHVTPVDAVVPWLTTNHPDPGDLATATADLTTAIGEVISGHLNGGEPVSTYLSGYSVSIYSYDPSFGTSCPGSSCPPPPQEFITVTSVPEAPSVGVFAVYVLFGGAGLLFWRRRRILRLR